MAHRSVHLRNEPAVIGGLPTDPEGQAASSGIGHGGAPGETPHLVIKRGHLGRYRFSFFFEGGRLSGDVHIEDRSVDRAGQDAEARAEIRKFVTALMATLA